MKNTVLLISILFCISSCENKESSLAVQNKLSSAIMQNIEWGGIPISSSLLPGEMSGSRTIMEEDYYDDVSLPAEYPLKFYINVDGDRVYLETKELIRLDIEQDLVIVISDSTSVINPLLK